MSEEFLDIYDEHGQPLGISKSRKQAHDQGLWHRVVDVWFLNSLRRFCFINRTERVH